MTEVAVHGIAQCDNITPTTPVGRHVYTEKVDGVWVCANCHQSKTQIDSRLTGGRK